MTKDGKYMIPAIQELNPVSLPSQNDKEKPSQNVPKTSKPKVELYVWSYCPYGVQMQGPMAEVAELLKGKAEFIIVPYYDGHGAYETQQNKIQLCIQKLAEDKYWSYAKGFVETIYSKCGSQRTEACDKNESISLMKKLGIDSSKIMSCVDSQGKTLLEEAAKKSQQNGVSGSPTVIINGVKVNVARTPESVKTAVCSAFENVPAECSKNLSSSASASSGSC
jgi:protein-disulfide isomerase